MMRDTLPAIDEVRVCEHSREDRCECRKPNPGMLLDAARQHGLALSKSFMVGDRESDVAAGREAGCRTIFVDLNYETEAKPKDPDWIVASLQDAVEVILAQTTGRNATCPSSTS